MKLALDTNAYCLCDLGHDDALTALEQASLLYLPVIAYGELYYGFKHGTQFHENLKRLHDFIREFQVTLIDVDADVAKTYGDIQALLKKKGRPIPTNDLWIAACCMSVGGTLLTADRHFLAIEAMRVEFLKE